MKQYISKQFHKTAYTNYRYTAFTDTEICENENTESSGEDVGLLYRNCITNMWFKVIQAGKEFREFTYLNLVYCYLIHLFWEEVLYLHGPLSLPFTQPCGKYPEENILCLSKQIYKLKF